MLNSFGEFLQRIMESGLEIVGLYYGVYRATVIDNADPDGQGKVMLHCPQVHGADYPKVWSWPETPYAGNGFGFWAVPDIGQFVYVRFDHGRPDKPIWHGGWWGAGDPTTDMVPTKVVLATLEGMKIVINRAQQTILIEQTLGNSILIENDDVTIMHDSQINVRGQNILIQSDGLTEVRAQGQCLVEALDDVSITSLGTIAVNAADTLTIVSADAVNIQAAKEINLQCDTDVNLLSTTNINLTAPAISFAAAVSFTGSVDITGDLGVTGGTTITGALTQDGPVTFTSDPTVNGDPLQMS